VSILSIPAGIGIIVIAPDLVRITIGHTWLPAVQPLRFLVIFGVLRSLSSGSGNVLKTTGNVRIFTILMITHAVVLTLLVFPLTEFFGIEGAGLALVFSSLINYVGQVYFANRAVGLDNGRLVLPFGKYGILAAGMGIVVQFLRMKTDGDSLLYLVLLVITGFVVYAVGILLFDRPFLAEISDEIGLRSRLPSRLTS
jgi:O-antigen/teichoic acid export membrane protein